MILYEQHYKLKPDYVIEKIRQFLAEDMPDGDVTSEGTIDPKEIAVAELEAQQDITLAGIGLLKFFFNDDFKIDIRKTDAMPAKSGDLLAKISGSAIEILKIERTMLNLVQRLCGIATQTARYVEIAKPHGVHILDTRKTTPGLREFEKYAVSCGGGTNHRMNLSSGILIKDNHIESAGGISKAVSRLKSRQSSFPVEVEVENFDQIREGLEAGVDGFLLDNMSPDTTEQAVRIIRNYKNGEDIFIESSGGITLRTLGDYVRTGINAVSIGALTHSVKAAEMHLEFRKSNRFL